MIQIDSYESKDYDRILSQSVTIERKLLNQLPGKTSILPDFVLLNGGKLVAINHKQAGEAIGNLTKLEEQLGRELNGLQEDDYLALMIDGLITCEPDGTCQTWRPGKNVWYPGHHYYVQYKSVAAFFNRLWMMGIPVIRTNGVVESCTEMVAIHDLMGKEEWEHKTFTRLIKEQFTLSGRDKLKSSQVKDFALTLMGIRGAGIGEEVAMALAEQFPNLKSLMTYMESGNFISQLFLRGEKRRIGPSIEGKLRMALGIE